MSFDWSAYLVLARHLVNPHSDRPTEEARVRCAISRAYYAAHCMARNYLRDRDNWPAPLHGGAHDQVIEEFRSSEDLTRRRIGNYLQLLKNNRVTADYYDNAGGLGTTDGERRKKAEHCFAIADQVIRALETL